MSLLSYLYSMKVIKINLMRKNKIRMSEGKKAVNIIPIN